MAHKSKGKSRKSSKVSKKELKRGLMFFVDQEKIEIERMKAKAKLRKKVISQTDDKAVVDWLDDDSIYQPISEYTLQRNEYLNNHSDEK